MKKQLTDLFSALALNILLISSFSVLIHPSASLAQVPNYVPTNGLVGWWPFNGNANDESGNGNNGAVNGATLTADRFGNANKAYSFDGLDDYIQTNFSGVIGNESRTVSFWAKTSGLNGVNIQNMNVVCYGSSGSGSNFEVALNHSCEGFSLDINNGVNTKSAITSDNTWRFYTIVFDNNIGNDFNAVFYYSNSNLLTSICQAGNLTTINTSNANPVVFGSYWNHLIRFFQGDIDDIAIWNRALSECEIKNLYTASLPSSTQTQTALDSYTWPVNGQTYTQSGQYTDTLTNASGCDSIITLDLTLSFTGIEELNANPTKKLVKITDLNGKETPFRKNTVLLFIYEDGTVERVYEGE